MSDEIKPALTAEEWAQIGGARSVLVLMDGRVFVGRGRRPGVPGERGLIFNREELTDRRSALAAALLQHAGPDDGPLFTWEDVDLLRRAAAEAGVGIDDEEARSEQGRDYANLADRIAALLPPRAL